MNLHINSPKVWEFRAYHKCPSSRTKRRCLVQMWEWYGSQKICGGCGNEWMADEGLNRIGKSTKRRNRAWVKMMWPNAWNGEQAMASLFEHISKQRLDAPAPSE